MTVRLWTLALAAGLTCALAVPAAAQYGAAAYLKDANGKPAGKVALTPSVKGLSGIIVVKGLTPGNHGMHIHMVGKCDGPGFASAGAHMNRGNQKHGLDNPMGPHSGDLPNLKVGADGTAQQYITVRMELADLVAGSAIVIHADPDDQLTDPSGNSGARLLCGVFQQST